VTEKRLAEVVGVQPPRGLWDVPFNASQKTPLPGAWSEHLVGSETLRTLFRPAPVPLEATVFMDVTNGATLEVMISQGPVAHWQSRPGESTRPTALKVGSVEELKKALANKEAVVSRGDPLPSEWEAAVDSTRIPHLHVSERSPKRTAEEHVSSVSALRERYDPVTTRIFTALPRIETDRSLADQIESIGLRLDQLEGWRRLDEEIRDVEVSTNMRLVVAEKAAILEELRVGRDNTIVIFAHSQDDNIRLSSGERITPEELSAIHREEAPARTIVLVSCGAGAVNMPTTGIGEILVANKMAANVIAPSGLVSATTIPDMLRRFVAGQETLYEAFKGIFWRIISLGLQHRISAESAENDSE
jgi:hypothetical protein